MPGEDIYSWSVTAASNDTSDTSINWRENQPRASVNDSSRSVMAALAKFRDLLKGSIVTSGAANAQTFTSGIGYTIVPTGFRALLKIGPTLTNTGTTTLSMDGIAAAPVKNKTGADLIGGELVAGGYIEVIYDGTNWILAADGKEKLNTTGGTITGGLVVTGSVSTGTLTTSGNATVGGTLTTTGNATVGGTLTTGSVVTTGGSVTIGPGGAFTLVDVGGFRELRYQGDEYKFSWDGSSGHLRYYANSVAKFQFLASGDYFITGSSAFKVGGGPWGDSSDARIKNIVGNYTSGLAEIVQLQPVRYSFKGNDTRDVPEAGDAAPYKTSPHHDAATDGKEFIGVVAQDAEQHLPELVTQASGYIDGAAVSDVRMLDTMPLVYALVNSVKELLQRIEALEAKM